MRSSVLAGTVAAALAALGMVTTRELMRAKACHDNAAAMSGALARAYHSDSAGNLGALVYAERAYAVYLAAFPDAADFPETQYYYAELLWARAESEPHPRLQIELWERAALAFTEVVKTGKVDAKLMKESAHAAVLGWKAALAVDVRVKAPAGAGDTEPRPIPERQQKLIAALGVYRRYITDPQDTELLDMKFLEANLYRRYNHFDEAIPLLGDVIEHHRDHETAVYAANLLLDAYNRLRRYGAALELVDKLSLDQRFFADEAKLQYQLTSINAVKLRRYGDFAP